MKMIADLTVVPIGVGVSLSKYVAACEDVLKQPGLKTTLHPNGTAIEGEWDAVMAAVKACHEKKYTPWARRASLPSIRLSSRAERVCRVESIFLRDDASAGDEATKW